MGESRVVHQRTPIEGEGVTSEEPDKFFFIEQLREAVGLPGPPLPITPKQAWEEALAEAKRLKELHG